jgi:hypothetical protein
MLNKAGLGRERFSYSSVSDKVCCHASSLLCNNGRPNFAMSFCQAFFRQFEMVLIRRSKRGNLSQLSLKSCAFLCASTPSVT